MRKAGWHEQDIIAAVRKKGSSLHQLAREDGRPGTTYTRALRKRFPHVQRRIASFLGLSCHELWPHWYDETDSLRPTSSSRQRRAA